MTSSAKLETIDVDPRRDPQWRFLQAHGGSLFTSSAWITAVAGTYELTPAARLLIASDGTACAGVAYCTVDDLRGRRIVSFPFSDYHEPLGRSSRDVANLLQTFTGGLPARFRMPDDRVPDNVEGVGFTARRDLLTHRIAVDASVDSETRFAALHPKVRQNIRRSRRAGIETDLSSEVGQIREFYDLHVEVRTRKYGLLPQPFSFFEAIHDAFAPSGALTVAIARHEGRAIAGIVYLEVGDTLYYKFNASNADELNVRPNEELVWAGMEICTERGLTGIDLGVSDTDQIGLVRYKRKLAQDEREVVTLLATGADPDPCTERVAEASALLPRLTELFTDEAVPLDIAERAGSLLYRYFV
jgi:CelD/BcsL family acetyltransferase involved in cellulose biosynthesis